jgi:hypothetical protein
VSSLVDRLQGKVVVVVAERKERELLIALGHLECEDVRVKIQDLIEVGNF